jgi:hypothetical protein
MMHDLSRKGLDKEQYKQFQDRHFKMSKYTDQEMRGRRSMLVLLNESSTLARRTI